MRRALIIVFWLIFALSMAVYVTMLVWTLPGIKAAADGLDPFDLRPGGYSFEAAKALLAALNADGLALYRGPQRLLDLIYPATLTLSVGLALYLLAPISWGRWRWLLAALAIPGTVFDYLENNIVQLLLFLGPTNITPEFVAKASTYTLLKSTFTTIALSALLLMLGWWLWRRFRPRAAA